MAARLGGAGRARGRCRRRGAHVRRAWRFMEASPWRGKTGGNQGALAMLFDAPFRAGAIHRGSPRAGLSPCDPEAAPAFLFRWHDRVVRARLVQADEQRRAAGLQATLGRVASTAGTPTRRCVRAASLCCIGWKGPCRRSGGLSLLADHRVWLEIETPIGLPITGGRAADRDHLVPAGPRALSRSAGRGRASSAGPRRSPAQRLRPTARCSEPATLDGLHRARQPQ